MSFEATLQVLQEQVRFHSLEAWLKTQADYDLVCRGLRTLRHLEAHVRPGSLSTKRGGAAHSRFAGTSLGGTTPWVLGNQLQKLLHAAGP